MLKQKNQSDATLAKKDAPPVRLDPGLDARMIAKVLAAHGRAHIPDILTPDTAQRLHRCLAQETPWSLVFNDGDKVYDLNADQLAEMTREKRIGLSDYLDTRARSGFQYLYNTFRIDGAKAAGTHRDLYLMTLLDFLNSAPFLDFARAITGHKDIRLADAQATMFGPGHFLSQHSDDVPGKHRRAAYVLNLTPAWRADWGGVLQFIGPDGHVTEGYVPAFNALNIFTVPQPHLVSYVTPFAGAPRLSVTGWLRAG